MEASAPCCVNVFSPALSLVVDFRAEICTHSKNINVAHSSVRWAEEFVLIDVSWLELASTAECYVRPMLMHGTVPTPRVQGAQFVQQHVLLRGEANPG